MSHEIRENDKQQGIEMAWHGLTEILSVILLATCWLANWDVTKRKLFRILADGTKEETDTCEITCTDDEKTVIGKPVHCETYTLLTNKRFLEIVQDALNRIPGAIVASVGSLCGRARIFVTLKIAQLEIMETAGREFKPYLSFLSSHDKSAPFTGVLNTTCTVCNNTFSMNLLDADGDAFRIRIPHTKNMEAHLKDVPEIVAAFFRTSQKFAEVMNALHSIPITTEDARAFFAGFLFDKAESETDGKTGKEIGEISTRKANQIDRLTILFREGKGNKGANLSDVFSAITDYYSHESSGGDDKLKQEASSSFGDGAAMKSFAFVILQDDKRTARLIETGKKVLANVKD